MVEYVLGLNHPFSSFKWQHALRGVKSNRWTFLGYAMDTTAFENTWKDYLTKMAQHYQDLGDPARPIYKPIFEGLFDKTYMHIWDEPVDQQDFDDVIYIAGLVDAANPAIDIEVTEEVREELIGAVDIWSLPHNIPYFNAVETEARQAVGEDIWVYNPAAPGPAFRIDYMAMDRRIESWWLWNYEIDGLFIWSVDR